MAAKLTEKQRLFCKEYLKDLNATQAYKRAGFVTKTDQAAGVAAHNLLKNINVQAYLSDKLQKRSDRTEVTVDRVLKELAVVAFSNITDTIKFNDDGIILLDSETMPESVQRSIQAVTCKKTEVRSKKGDLHVTTVKTVRLYDKVKALETLAKHTGLAFDLNYAIATLKKYYGDRVVVQGDGSIKIGDDAIVLPTSQCSEQEAYPESIATE